MNISIKKLNKDRKSKERIIDDYKNEDAWFAEIYLPSGDVISMTEEEGKLRVRCTTRKVSIELVTSDSCYIIPTGT